MDGAGLHRSYGVGRREGLVRHAEHGEVVGVVADADQLPAAAQLPQLQRHGPLVGSLGGQLQQMVAGEDQLIVLRPALLLEVGEKRLQLIPLRREQRL